VRQAVLNATEHVAHGREQLPPTAGRRHCVLRERVLVLQQVQLVQLRVRRGVGCFAGHVGGVRCCGEALVHLCRRLAWRSRTGCGAGSAGSASDSGSPTTDSSSSTTVAGRDVDSRYWDCTGHEDGLWLLLLLVGGLGQGLGLRLLGLRRCGQMVDMVMNVWRGGSRPGSGSRHSSSSSSSSSSAMPRLQGFEPKPVRSVRSFRLSHHAEVQGVRVLERRRVVMVVLLVLDVLVVDGRIVHVMHVGVRPVHGRRHQVMGMQLVVMVHRASRHRRRCGGLLRQDEPPLRYLGLLPILLVVVDDVVIRHRRHDCRRVVGLVPSTTGAMLTVHSVHAQAARPRTAAAASHEKSECGVRAKRRLCFCSVIVVLSSPQRRYVNRSSSGGGEHQS
jgi:hypothetical protein